MDNYENLINTFYKNFTNISNIISECIQDRTKLIDSLSSMKDKYSTINKTNNKPIFLFCLDSFLYQYKNFSIELENINKLWLLHNNRMYCDYYKLYNIILKYMKDDSSLVGIDTSLNQFPVYKELEQTKEYDISDITKLHETILSMIKQICITIQSKTDEINNYNTNSKIGFSISNYINTLNYENMNMITQTTLYINYMSFFHISQKKYIMDLHNKINSILTEINNNMNIDRMCSIDDVMNEIQNENMCVIPNNNDTNKLVIITADCSTNTMETFINSPISPKQSPISPKNSNEPTLFITQFSNNNL